MYDDSSSTIAGIAANAQITSAGDLAVAATSTNETYLIDPGAGTGGGIGVTGIVVLSDLSEATHASIASSATISAPVVSVLATEGVNLWTASGAVSTGTGTGVGLSASVNEISTDTSAIVGDNSADAATADVADAVAGASTSSTTGSIGANTLTVHANTYGQAGALSIGLAKAGAGSPGGLSSLVAGAQGKLAAASGVIDSVKAKLDPLLNPVSYLIDKSSSSATSSGGTQSASSSGTPAQGSAGQQETSSGSQGFSIGIAGAVSVGLYGANTTASVGHVALNPYATGSGATIATDILATRDASFFTLAGGASKVGSGDGSSGSSVGVAGALALTEDSGNTLANLVSVTDPRAGTTSVQALSNGQTIGVGITAAIDGDQNSTAVAASGTLSFLHGATNADVANSTLTGVGAVDLRVRSYNATEIALGGGSFFKGGKGGLGATLTLSLVGDSTSTDPVTGLPYSYVGAHVVGTTASFAHVGVEADAPIRLIDAAASAGAASGPNGVAIALGAAYGDIGRSISATVTTSSLTATASGGAAAGCADETCGILVTAGGDRSSTLDALIGNPTATDADVDFNAATAANSALTNDPTGASIISVAGLFEKGNTAAGLEFAGGNIHDNYTATVTSSTLNAVNSDIAVLTHDSAYIGSLSVGAAVSTGNSGLAFMGSATVNLISTGDIASITGSSSAVTAEALTVDANAAAAIDSLAGNIAGSTGGTAIGVAVGFNQISRTISSQITGFTVNAATLGVTAEAAGHIRTASVAGALANGTAIGGSFTINNLADTVAATLGAGTTVANTSGYTTVAATNSGRIDTLAGGIGVSLDGAGVGVAVAVNLLSGTTSADVTGATIKSADLDVIAKASGNIGVIAVGAGVGAGSAGIGGSIVTDILSNTTSAKIEGGSTVTAANSVSVQAADSSGVFVSSGAAGIGSDAGVGLGVATNILGATSTALVDSSTVTAGGAGAGRSVNTGTLVTPIDTSTLMCLGSSCNHDNDASAYSTLFVQSSGNATDPVTQMSALTYNAKTVNGLSVNAITTQNVAVLSAAVGVSGTAAFAADVGTSLVSGTTKAEITGSTIDAASGAHGAVDVLAGGTTLIGNIIAGVAGSGSVAGAGAVAAASFEQTVRADVTNSAVGTSGHSASAISITALGTQESFGITAGAALSGSLAFAGSGLVNLFQSNTSAQLIGAPVYASSLAINADTFDSVGGATGAIAVGFGAGAGAGAFDVTYMRDSTTATVGSNANTTTTALNLAGDLTVHAEGHDRFAGLAVSGAGGAFAGISGLANVLYIDSAVRAGVYNATLVPTAGAVAVTSLIETTMAQAGGAIGVGPAGVGLGVALNLAIVKDSATSEVSNSTLNASSVTVTADKTRSISATTISAGVGFAGAGASINLDLIGTLGAGGLADSDSGDLSSSSALNGMIGNTDSLSSSDLSGNNASLSASQRSSASTATGFGIAGALTAPTTASTTARVTNSTIKANALSILGTVTSSTSATVGGFGGGLVGVGGAVGFTRLRDSVAATTDATTVVTVPVVTIAAVTKDGSGGSAAAVNAIAGAAGVVGLGASVADVDVKNVLTATAAGTFTGNGNSGDSLSVTATDSTTQNATGLGASVGAGAAGLSAGVVNRDSTIVAQFDTNTKVDKFNTLSITATDSGSATTTSYAASGGVGVALSGAVATAIDASSVTAQINSGAVSNVGSGLTIAAMGTTGLSAEADGAAVSGGVAIGLSVATATANQSVSALDNGTAHGGAGSLTVSATLATPSAISALARAAAGGLLGGGQASVAYAYNNAHVDAELNGNDSTSQSLTNGASLNDGNVSVLATNNNSVSADAEGLVLGFYAGGAVVSEADANSVTSASIGAASNTATQLRSGDLTVKATSTDTTSSYALSGSGGVIAGAAASANTSNTSQTNATIGTRGLSGGTITVDAVHTAYYAGAADAKQAAVAGASGAIVVNNLAATTTTSIGNGAILTAADMHILANNNYFNASLPHGEGYAGVGGAGGLANVGAVSVTTTLGGTAKVAVGDNVQMYVLGDPITLVSSGSDAGIYIDATTTAVTSDGATLELAGAFEGPFAATQVTGTYTNRIDIGTGTANAAKTTLSSDGIIAIGTQARVQEDASADVTVYGLAGAGGGKSNITVTSNQQTNINGNADLLAYGQLRLGAGVTSDGATMNSINSSADTHVFNNTVIPITAILDANATSNSNNTLTINAGARVRSALDVTLTSAQGDVKADGAYVGSNPYLTLFSSDSTGGNSTMAGNGSLLLGGQVIAGVANVESLTVSGTQVNATSSLNDDNSPTRFYPSGVYVSAGQSNAFTPDANINARLIVLNYAKAGKDANGNPLAVQPNADDIASIQGEIDVLTALEGALNNTGAVDSIQTMPVYAAGGDININAATIAKVGNGAASLTAQGDATVTITNPTGASLLIGQVYMPTSGSGTVKYLGTAGGVPSGIAISQSADGAAPKLLIQNTQDSAAPGSTSAGSSIFIVGDIYNPTGSTTITNLSGSIAQFSSITTAQLTMNAPNGSFFVNQAGIWNEVDPASEWSILPVTQGYGIFGIPDSVLGIQGVVDPFGIVDYATNFIYNRNGALDTDHLAKSLIGNGLSGIEAVGLIGNNKNDDNDSGYTHGVDGDLPFRVGGSGDSQYIHYYGPYGDDSWYLLYSAPLAVATIKTESAAQENTIGTQVVNPVAGQVVSSIDVGRSVVINANTININGAITAGHATTQSVTLNNAAQAYINQYNAWLAAGSPSYQASQFTVVNGLLSLDSFTGTGTGVVRAAYDARGQITQNGTTVTNPNAGKIVLANVDASGGGSITLNGQIINTDGEGLGQLNVRSGLGQVTINNQTSTALVVGAIATGTGDQNGVIKITDRSFHTADNSAVLTTWWVNPQGTDQVLQYSNYANDATDVSKAVLVGSSNDRTSSYTPMANLRYTWDDQYNAVRTVTNPGGSWTDISVSNWVVGTHSDNEPFTRGAAYITTGSSSDPFFVSQVTAANFYNNYDQYVGWHNYAYHSDGSLNVAHTIIPQGVNLTVNNSIKADNPIGIHFIGNDSANVGITSIGDVYFAGAISDAKGRAERHLGRRRDL